MVCLPNQVKHQVKQYLALLQYAKTHGLKKQDRTGTGTLSVFGYQMRFDISRKFPLLTTKRLHVKSVIYELLWFLRGDTNVSYLQRHGVHIWDEWSDAAGELGPVYGKQWRAWQTADGRVIDQIAKVIKLINTEPDSRRLLVSAWNVGELEQMALMPCHALFQFYVRAGKLSCQLYQRSADIFLGVPFNIASYALLTMMVAQVTKLQPDELIIVFGDAHIYLNHQQQVDTQLARTPLALPEMRINPEIESIFDFRFEDFELINYVAHPHIPAPIAV